MDKQVEELICKVVDGCATAEEERRLREMSGKNPEIRAELEEQQGAVSAIRSVGLPELQDEVTEQFARGVYNRLESRMGWVLVVAGLVLLTGYILYEVLTDPGLHTVYRVGLAAVIIGFGLLLSGVWRGRCRTGRADPYKGVQR